MPDGQSQVSGRNIKVGSGSVAVSAERGQSTLTTTVTLQSSADLRIGHVLPDGATVTQVSLNGAPVEYEVRSTARGDEVVVPAGDGGHTHTLVVTYE